MSRDDKHRGRRKAREAKRQIPLRIKYIDTQMTVGQFARQVANWLVEYADEDDIQRFFAEFKGVPIERVIVTGDDIRILV